MDEHFVLLLLLPPLLTISRKGCCSVPITLPSCVIEGRGESWRDSSDAWPEMKAGRGAIFQSSTLCKAKIQWYCSPWKGRVDEGREKGETIITAVLAQHSSKGNVPLHPIKEVFIKKYSQLKSCFQSLSRSLLAN